jgi:hypothetical protein
VTHTHHQRRTRRHLQDAAKPTLKRRRPAAVEPDWMHDCAVCGASPIVPLTGLCGPCTFGEADTMGGNW